MFGLVIIANSAIGIIQELRAKRTLDQLADRRPGQTAWCAATACRVEMAPSEVVLDDIIELGPGDQIVVDGVVLEARQPRDRRVAAHRRVRPRAKDAGDQVLSGSFVASGSGAYSGHEGRRRRVRRQARRRRPASSRSCTPSCAAASTRSCKFITYLLVPGRAADRLQPAAPPASDLAER